MSQVTLLVPKGCVMRMSLDATCGQDVSCSPKTEASIAACATGTQCAPPLLHVSASSQTEEEFPETMEGMEMPTTKRQRREVVVLESNATAKRKAKTPFQTSVWPNVQTEEEMKLLEQAGRCDDLDTVPKSKYLEVKRELRAAQEELKAMNKRRFEVKDAAVATEEGSATYFSLQEKFAHLKGEMSVAEKKIKDLEGLNVRLQNSLMSKLLAAEGKLIYATASDVAVNCVPGEGHSTEPHEGKLMYATASDVAVNCIPVEGHSMEPHGSDPPLHNIDEGPCQTDILPESEVSTSESVEQEGSQSQCDKGADTSGTDDPIKIGSSREDGKLYAGSKQWVSKEAWGALFRAPTDSVFCRLAANVYWTREQLQTKSVTGTLSNKSLSLGKTKPKPALSPEKVASLKAIFQMYIGDGEPAAQEKRLKAVRKHLSQKLGDMQRKGTKGTTDN